MTGTKLPAATLELSAINFSAPIGFLSPFEGTFRTDAGEPQIVCTYSEGHNQNSQ